MTKDGETKESERWYLHDRLRDMTRGLVYRPEVGDLAVILGARLKSRFWRACGVVVKITKRRADKTCRDPIKYWHIRGVDGVVRRWTNIACERVFEARDVANLRAMLKP